MVSLKGAWITLYWPDVAVGIDSGVAIYIQYNLIIKNMHGNLYLLRFVYNIGTNIQIKYIYIY